MFSRTLGTNANAGRALHGDYVLEGGDDATLLATGSTIPKHERGKELVFWIHTNKYSNAWAFDVLATFDGSNNISNGYRIGVDADSNNLRVRRYASGSVSSTKLSTFWDVNDSTWNWVRWKITHRGRHKIRSGNIGGDATTTGSFTDTTYSSGDMKFTNLTSQDITVDLDSIYVKNF